MRSFLSELTKRMRRGRGCTRLDVAWDGEGFSVIDGSAVRGRVLWSDVIEVFAYKADLFSVDEICIGFRLDSSGTHCWVSEEFRRYKEFVEQLRIRFPGIREDWFSDVAFPAFAENRTTLWGGNDGE
jgi:hypothetical protein